MQERDKRLVGEEIEPGDRPKAPGRLALVQRFVNTYSHEFPRDWDRLENAAKAQAWLRKTELIGPREQVSADGAAQLRELREALRALIIGRPVSPFSAPLVVTLEGEGTALAPAEGGVDGVTATLLGIVHEARLSGEWTRMKACRQCEYAFFDRSKNRSATWCSMSICGNRLKNRAYYRRHRDE